MHHLTLLLEDQQGKLKCTTGQWHPRKMEQPKDRKRVKVKQNRQQHHISSLW